MVLFVGMRISRSGFAKRASTWEVWRFVPGPPIARFLVGRLEREEIEVGMLSGMFSDIVAGGQYVSRRGKSGMVVVA